MEKELTECLSKAKRVIGSLRRSMSSHPDCEEGSEFHDYAGLAQETEDEIKELITNTK